MGLILKRIIAVMAFFVSIWANAQAYHGFVDDNFNGVYGVVTNPANVVDSRHVFNINLASFNSLLASDYDTPKLGNAQLFREGTKSWLFDGPLRNLTEGEIPSNTIANLDALAPLSFMLNLNEQHAIGLLIRGRGIYNYNNMDGRFWKGLANGFFAETDFSFENQRLDMATHYWTEIGLTYGTVILDQGEHFVKVGGTFKLLQGLGAEQIYIDGQNGQTALSGEYNAVDNSVDLAGDLTYLRAFPIDTPNENIGLGERLGNAAFGIGGDIGFVYEYRSRGSRRSGFMRNAAGFNKYKFKLAVSLLDLGKIAYDNTQVVSRTVAIGQTRNFDAETLSNSFFDTLSQPDANNPEGNVTSGTGELEIALPTSLQISADYLVQDGGPYYINASFNSTLVQSSDLFNNNRINLYALTPRYETKHYAIYLPLSYSEISSFNVGLGARLGPVTLGSASFLNLFTGEGNMSSLYLGVNVPLLQDRDQVTRRRGKHHKTRRKNHRRSRRRR